MIDIEEEGQILIDWGSAPLTLQEDEVVVLQELLLEPLLPEPLLPEPLLPEASTSQLEPV